MSHGSFSESASLTPGGYRIHAALSLAVGMVSALAGRS